MAPAEVETGVDQDFRPRPPRLCQLFDLPAHLLRQKQLVPVLVDLHRVLACLMLMSEAAASPAPGDAEATAAMNDYRFSAACKEMVQIGPNRLGLDLYGPIVGPLLPRLIRRGRPVGPRA